MKITVIATGFDKAISSSEPVRPYTGPPTGGGTERSSHTSEHTRRDDINVPTFIRKKAD
jgi:hypothetical protein